MLVSRSRNKRRPVRIAVGSSSPVGAFRSCSAWRWTLSWNRQRREGGGEFGKAGHLAKQKEERKKFQDDVRKILENYRKKKEILRFCLEWVKSGRKKNFQVKFGCENWFHLFGSWDENRKEEKWEWKSLWVPLKKFSSHIWDENVETNTLSNAALISPEGNIL